eukprot:scaffold92676_cov30-Tisochrysis_lutea.AAC.5
MTSLWSRGSYRPPRECRLGSGAAQVSSEAACLHLATTPTGVRMTRGAVVPVVDEWDDLVKHQTKARAPARGTPQ